MELQTTNSFLVGLDQLDGHFLQPRELGGSVPALAGDQLINIVAEVADDEWVLQADRLDALGKFAHFFVGGAFVSRSHLVEVGTDAIDAENEQRLIRPAARQRSMRKGGRRRVLLGSRRGRRSG